MSDELDRLHNRLSEVYPILAEIQKSNASIDGELHTHLKVFEVKSLSYEKEISDLKKRMTQLEDFRIDHEARNKGVTALKGWIRWIFTTILLIYTFFKTFGGFSAPGSN